MWSSPKKAPEDRASVTEKRVARLEKLVDGLEYRVVVAEAALRLLATESDAMEALQEPGALARLRSNLRDELADRFSVEKDDEALERAVDDMIDSLMTLLGE